MRLRILQIAGWLAFLVPCQAQEFKPGPFDWPQWQGPARDNRSRETGLLTRWPKSGPKLLWKITDAGGGYSAPTIAAGRLFGLSYVGDDEVAWARVASTGKLLWSAPIAKANRTVDYREGSRSSATIDVDRLFALGVSGDLVCLNVATGKEIWRKNLVRDFGGVLPFYRDAYGYTESPLVDGERLLVTPGGPKNTVVALEKTTGKTIWTAAVPEPRFQGQSRAAYSSLVPGAVAGVRQYVQVLQGTVVSISDAGKLLWRWDKPSSDIANCTAPVFAHDLVFATAGYSKGCGLARIVPKGSEFVVQELYFNKNLKNVHGGIVLVNGHVFGNSDPGLLTCLELRTGKALWKERAAGKGAVLFADGHLYYRDEQGPVLLIEATPKGYVEKGRFNPPDRSKKNAWSHPVLANGRLYLRDQGALQCYDVRHD